MGGCGKIKCNKKDNVDSCNTNLERDYKFYLSFENSFCEQYVTEKFFKRMNQSVVPIVMGKAPYSQIAPPNSYINVQDFPNPKALADYLLKLDKSPEDYLSYFWWKKQYVSRAQPSGHKALLCQLCDKLNSNQPPKVYHDLSQWWTQDSHCEKKGTFKWTQTVQSWFMETMNSKAAELLGKGSIWKSVHIVYNTEKRPGSQIKIFLQYKVKPKNKIKCKKTSSSNPIAIFPDFHFRARIKTTKWFYLGPWLKAISK